MVGDKTGTKPRSYHQHGLWTLRAALEEFGSDKWLDHIGPTGVALRAWKESLVEDLGGWDNLSTQQLALVDLVARQMLLIESVDRFVIANQAIVNERNRKLFRVMLDRQRMADSWAKYLQMLGLEKRAPEGQDLSAYVREKYGDDENGANR